MAGGGETITQMGTQIGTPAYMAPEQAAGDPDVDFRADLYAFGVMAYELLAGQHPFAERRTAHALVVAHMTETPKALTTHTTNVTSSHGEHRHAVSRQGSGGASRRARRTSSRRSRARRRRRRRCRRSSRRRRRATATIAVLPFANMSGDPDNEYFSDGITDDIISALTQVKGLRVAARTSAFSYKGKNEDLATIGKTLGVTTVLQGSVRRAGNKVRVTAQLMNAHDGFQLWSERFDRDLDDIFAIQDEIARSIVEQLELTLGLKDAKSLVARPTDDLQAYELYLRGREAVAAADTAIDASRSRVLRAGDRARSRLCARASRCCRSVHRARRVSGDTGDRRTCEGRSGHRQSRRAQAGSRGRSVVARAAQVVPPARLAFRRR